MWFDGERALHEDHCGSFESHLLTCQASLYVMCHILIDVCPPHLDVICQDVVRLGYAKVAFHG